MRACRHYRRSPPSSHGWMDVRTLVNADDVWRDTAYRILWGSTRNENTTLPHQEAGDSTTIRTPNTKNKSKQAKITMALSLLNYLYWDIQVRRRRWTTRTTMFYSGDRSSCHWSSRCDRYDRPVADDCTGHSRMLG